MIKNVKMAVGNIMKIIQGGIEEDDNEVLLSVWESVEERWMLEFIKSKRGVGVQFMNPDSFCSLSLGRGPARIAFQTTNAKV